MTEQDFFRALDKSFADNGLSPLDEGQKAAFFALLGRLLEANAAFNLTAITDPREVIAKHFADSLLGEGEIPKGATVLDIGCGAGFPTLPLAIVRPDLSLIALDSTAKKVGFVAETADFLRLSNVRALCGRAEDEATRKAVGKPDVVVSRAVARLNLLSELALPYLPVGGLFLAMKGAQGEEELEEAARSIALLGGSKANVTRRALILADGSTESRTLLSIIKESPTPKGYPRPYAAMKKKPL